MGDTTSELLVGGVGDRHAAVFLMPQILRITSDRDAAGVSTGSAAYGVANNCAWTAYLVSLNRREAAMAPLVAVLAFTLTL